MIIFSQVDKIFDITLKSENKLIQKRIRYENPFKQIKFHRKIVREFNGQTKHPLCV